MHTVPSKIAESWTDVRILGPDRICRLVSTPACAIFACGSTEMQKTETRTCNVGTKRHDRPLPSQHKPSPIDGF